MATAAAAFVRSVIGMPWQSGAQGPDAFDCWGLARAAQRELFGYELPPVSVNANHLRSVIEAIEGHAIRQEWHNVEIPAHGDLVTLARHDHPTHIGVYLAVDRGGLLHCARDVGVCFDHIQALAWQGWARLRFLRRVVPT